MHSCPIYAGGADLLGNRPIFSRGWNAEQFGEPRFISFARRAPAVLVNAFGMFPAQSIAHLLLKLNVCLDIIRNG